MNKKYVENLNMKEAWYPQNSKESRDFLRVTVTVSIKLDMRPVFHLFLNLAFLNHPDSYVRLFVFSHHEISLKKQSRPLTTICLTITLHVYNYKRMPCQARVSNIGIFFTIGKKLNVQLLMNSWHTPYSIALHHITGGYALMISATI